MWCQCWQCMYVIPSLICCVPCFIYLCQFCHMLNANFNVFGIIIVCDVLKFLHAIPKLSSYVNFNTGCMLIGMWYLKTFSCCITIHLWYTKISIFAVSSFLIFGISTFIKCYMPTWQMFVVSKFISGSTFAIIPYGEKLSSLAVACWS